MRFSGLDSPTAVAYVVRNGAKYMNWLPQQSEASKPARQRYIAVEWGRITRGRPAPSIAQHPNRKTPMASPWLTGTVGWPGVTATLSTRVVAPAIQPQSPAQIDRR